jgi:hypothetical protein
VFRVVSPTLRYVSMGRFPEASEILCVLASWSSTQVYFFRAERTSIGRCSYGSSPVLASNAANLAEVLLGLQSNVHRLGRYNCLVSRVLPDIKWISVVSLPNNSDVEVRVWSHSRDSGRDDLAVPLSESGTGVGQILAIL